MSNNKFLKKLKCVINDNKLTKLNTFRVRVKSKTATSSLVYVFIGNYASDEVNMAKIVGYGDHVVVHSASWEGDVMPISSNVNSIGAFTISSGATHDGGYVDIKTLGDIQKLMICGDVEIDYTIEDLGKFYDGMICYGVSTYQARKGLNYEGSPKMSSYVANAKSKQAIAALVPIVSNHQTNVEFDINNITLSDFGIFTSAARIGTFPNGVDMQTAAVAIAEAQVSKGRTTGTLQCAHATDTKTITFNSSLPNGYSIE